MVCDSIGDSAYHSCLSLILVIMPDSVTRLGDGAFEGCLNLVSIVIPPHVRTIGEFAFFQCASLVSIVIPDSVYRLGPNVFQSCFSLVSVYLPATLTGLDDGLAYLPSCYGYGLGVTGLDQPRVHVTCFPCGNEQQLVIPSNVTSVGAYSFAGCPFVVGHDPGLGHEHQCLEHTRYKNNTRTKQRTEEGKKM